MAAILTFMYDNARDMMFHALYARALVRGGVYVLHSGSMSQSIISIVQRPGKRVKG